MNHLHSSICPLHVFPRIAKEGGTQVGRASNGFCNAAWCVLHAFLQVQLYCALLFVRSLHRLFFLVDCDIFFILLVTLVVTGTQPHGRPPDLSLTSVSGSSFEELHVGAPHSPNPPLPHSGIVIR